MSTADPIRRRAAPEPERPASSPAAPEARVAGMPERMLAMQRAAGNQAVVQSIQRWDWRDIADPIGVTSAAGGVIGFITAGAVDQQQFKSDVHAAKVASWRYFPYVGLGFGYAF